MMLFTYPVPASLVRDDMTEMTPKQTLSTNAQHIHVQMSEVFRDLKQYLKELSTFTRSKVRSCYMTGRPLFEEWNSPSN